MKCANCGETLTIPAGASRPVHSCASGAYEAKDAPKPKAKKKRKPKPRAAAQSD